MKLNIENYLQQIDNSFKEKSKKDIYMMYIMVFASLFAFSYLLFWESAEADFQEKRTKVTTVQSKIKADERFLLLNPETKITQLEKDIEDAKKELIVQKDNNQYIKTKIETISFLIYDERAWGEYLHSISENAQKHNVKLIDFTNKYAQSSQSFGHILDITLKISGKYKNTLSFINSLEQSDLVVDIHHLDIKAQNKLNTDINISVWGITY